LKRCAAISILTVHFKKAAGFAGIIALPLGYQKDRHDKKTTFRDSSRVKRRSADMVLPHAGPKHTVIAWVYDAAGRGTGQNPRG
jgi:hypothetical protein